MSIRYHGVDTGSHFGLVTMEQDGGIVLVVQHDKQAKRGPRKERPANKHRPAMPASPAVELWQRWAQHCRWCQLALEDVVSAGDVVALEDVRRHKGVLAAHAYGRLLGIVEQVCYIRDARLVLVGVGTAKRTATGHGQADKEEMIAAAVERWGSRVEWTEHTADAAWVAETARRGQE